MKKAIITACCLLSLAFGWAQEDLKHSRIEKNLSIYTDVMRLLDMYYVDTLNYELLLHNSIEASLRKLDPYTVYVPESKTDDLTFMTTGSYGGIGALIMQRDNYVIISDPYEGMPAQKAGLRAGDLMLKINKENVESKTVSEVSALLRGAPHEKISITVKREGEPKPLRFDFEREKIQINPVPYTACIAPRTGYVALTDFTDRAALEVKNAINRLIATDSITSLVLDLRNNGGGIIDEAVKIVGYFVPKGTEVVSTKGKVPQVESTYKTTVEPIYPDMRVVVLVNRSSASASEIVAGALQDLDRGILIGERTFGKGLVQTIRPLSHNGHLKLTTAKYYIPSGRCIQAIDYSHRNEDGSVGRVPDSLTHVFRTRIGREVRDGGGVTPDIEIKQPEGFNITYYLYVKNMFFDFATRYASTHPTIATPEQFELSQQDYNDFQVFLQEKEFTYTPQTSTFLDELKEIAKYEQLDSIASQEIAALEAKLKPSIANELQRHKTEITDMLSMEIIKRYYYQKGAIAYSLRNDNELEAAKAILIDNKRYKGLLAGEKQY